MKDRGFLPLTAVGLIILVLAVSVVGYYQWNRHQVEMKSVNTSADSSLTTSVASGRNDIGRQAREALYSALWKVGKNASSYEEEGQENQVERLAKLNLGERLSSLAAHRENHPLHPQLELENRGPKFELKREDGGYPHATVRLPAGTSVSGTLPDNSLLISLPSENFETLADVRFYLLKDRMNGFEDGLGEIEKRWKYAEYAMAYAQAWAGGSVNLSEKRSRALFQLALASHEIDKFGSTDYRAIMEDLTGLSNADRVIDGYDPGVVVEPIQEGEIQNLGSKVDDSLSQIQKSSADLRGAVSAIKEVARFQPESWLEGESEKFSDLRGKVENADVQYLGRKFREICNDFKSIYTFPKVRVSKMSQKVRDAKQSVRKARNRFQSALTSMKKLSENNPLVKQLYEDFTREGESPGIASQVRVGAERVLENFEPLEERIRKLEGLFPASDGFEEKFPANFSSRFKKALEDEDRKLAEEILSEASASATQAFNDFEAAADDGLEEVDSVYHQLNAFAASQTQKPEANWRKTYDSYPGPGENYGEKPEKKSVEKYVIRSGGGTIGGLEKVLGNAKSHLGRLENLSEEFKGQRGELKRFRMDESLKSQLKGKINYRVPEDFAREESYELSPPKPLKSDPGLSVYHEIEIEDVEYNREDPLGLAEDSAPPTPIYLWFIGVTLYWAQWNVNIEIEEPLVEEIFDYRNQTIPRPVIKGSKSYVHKPLPYRQEFQELEFSFRLVVISLRPFGISSD